MTMKVMLTSIAMLAVGFFAGVVGLDYFALEASLAQKLFWVVILLGPVQNLLILMGAITGSYQARMITAGRDQNDEVRIRDVPAILQIPAIADLTLPTLGMITTGVALALVAA